MCLIVWFLYGNKSFATQSTCIVILHNNTFYLTLGDFWIYKFLATQSPYIWILPSMTPHVTHESLATQSTMIWIVSSMNLLVVLYVVQGYGTLATQSSILWLELTPTYFVPLATLKSKVLPIQLAQDTAYFQKCCL